MAHFCARVVVLCSLFSLGAYADNTFPDFKYTNINCSNFATGWHREGCAAAKKRYEEAETVNANNYEILKNFAMDLQQRFPFVHSQRFLHFTFTGAYQSEENIFQSSGMSSVILAKGGTSPSTDPSDPYQFKDLNVPQTIAPRTDGPGTFTLRVRGSIPQSVNGSDDTLQIYRDEVLVGSLKRCEITPTPADGCFRQMGGDPFRMEFGWNAFVQAPTNGGRTADGASLTIKPGLYSLRMLANSGVVVWSMSFPVRVIYQ